MTNHALAPLFHRPQHFPLDVALFGAAALRPAPGLLPRRAMSDFLMRGLIVFKGAKFMDVAGSISAVGAALGIVKELREINAQMDQATLKLKVAEPTEALAEAKLGLIDVAEELRVKDREIVRISELLKHRETNLVDYHGYRYRAVDGKPVGKAYYPVCESRGLHVTLAQDRTKNGYPETCPSCKGVFGHVSSFAHPE